MDFALEPLLRKLEPLLRESAEASAENLTMRTWQLTNEFALRYWAADSDDALVIAGELPRELVGDYWILRATVAENVGLINEAAMAYAQLLELGEQTGRLATADIAWANLCFLQPGEEALAHHGERLERWLGGSYRDVSSADATLIASAAMLGYTAETGTGSPDSARLELFTQITEAYGSNNPSEADRLLWRAQQEHVAGNSDKAIELATRVIGLAEAAGDAVAQFEGHDMLGNLALMDVNEPEVTFHFAQCFALVSDHGAPVVALQRAATASWASFSTGQVDFAAQLATSALAACDRMPAGKVQPDLLTVLGNCALERGEAEEAALWAQRVREY